MAAVCMGLLLLIPLIDLAMKRYVENHFSREEERLIWKNRVALRHVHNEGMALNCLDRNPVLVRWLSLLVTIPMTIYYLILLCKRGRNFEKISLSLVLGGAISNLYDRFKRKYVVDYFGFQTKWKKLTDITYNLGDMAIFAGAFGMLICGIFRRK